MPTQDVRLTLNQQQRELLLRTVGRGVAPDLESLVRLALREYAAWHAAPPSAAVSTGTEAAR